MLNDESLSLSRHKRQLRREVSPYYSRFIFSILIYSIKLKHHESPKSKPLTATNRGVKKSIAKSIKATRDMEKALQNCMVKLRNQVCICVSIVLARADVVVST